MSKGQGTRKHDPRWALYGIQPRARVLTRRIRDIARQDRAFADELRKRTEPARIDALVAGQGRFWSETPCPRCGSPHRRVSDRACWDCWQRKHRPPAVWEAIQAGRGYFGGTRSRDGWLDQQDVRRRIRAGEFNTITQGDITAHEHPDGRLEITQPPDLLCPDLRAIHTPRLFQLAAQHPALVEVLRRAGWSID